MALDAAQFDPTLLPLEAQALAPDVEGNVTARGILGERADDRSFKIESGKVTIIERGHERPAKGNEIRDVIAALNVSIRDEQVRVTSEKLGSQELRVRLRFSNGVQEKTLEEYMIQAQLNRTRDAVRATTAEQEQNENRLRQKTKERAEALNGLQKKREAILEEQGEGLEDYLGELRTASGVAKVVRYFNQALRTHQNDVPELTRVLEQLNTSMDMLSKVLVYEDEVQAAARANGVEAGDPEWSQLSLSKKDNLQELHDELDALGKQFDQRVETLADASAFGRHWGQNLNLLSTRINGDFDTLVDLKKFGRSLYSLEESLKNVVLPDHMEQNLKDIRTLLDQQRELLLFKEKLEENAKKSGIDLDDGTLGIFDAIRNPARAQLVAALEALEKAARIDLGYELGVKKAFDKVFGSATDDEQAAIQKIWYGKTDETNYYEEDLNAESSRLNQIQYEDHNPTNFLTEGQELLEENTGDLTHLKEVYEASSQALNEQDVPQGSLNEGKRKQEKAAIVAAFAKHSADLNTAIEANQATLKKIEAILARRGEVKERAKKHRAPKKGRIGKAVDAVAGMNPLKGLVAAKDAARQERIDSAQKVNRLTGVRTLEYSGGQIVLRFNDDGTVQQQVESGNNNPDGTPIMEWGGTLDQAEVCKILNAQKDKAEDEMYRLNEEDPAAPYIEEVRGTGEVDTGLGARARDWLSGARNNRQEARTQSELDKAKKRREKQERRERQAVIDETKLMPILEELRKEGKPEYEARDLTRSLLRDEKDMDQEEADAVFAQAWKALEDKANSWWTKGRAWLGGVPGRIKGDWDKGEEGNIGKFWKGTKANGGKFFKWAGELLPSGDTALKAGGAVLGGLSVGAGLLGLGGIYLTTNIVRGALVYGGQVAHQFVEKGGKLAGTAKNTAVNVVKAPFRLVASPLTGAWNGLVNGWNYPDPAQHRKPKGWTAPLTWMRNKLSSAWRMTKAAPTAIVAASLGLVLGAAYRGPVDSLAPVIGINAKAPVPAFMLHQEKHSPNVIEVAEKAAPAKAAAPAADHGGHGAHGGH